MRRVVIAVVVALAAACSNPGSNDPVTPGCSSVYTDTCTAGGAMTTTLCGAQYGTWLAGGCPSSNRVGVCAWSTGEIVSYYEPWTALSARYDCDGTWLSEPQPIPIVGTGPETTVSCTLAGALCLELTAPGGSSALDSLESDCSGNPYYSYAAAGCAVTSPVPGHCELTDAAYAGAVVSLYYSSSWYSADEAAASCADSGGTWRP